MNGCEVQETAGVTMSVSSDPKIGQGRTKEHENTRIGVPFFSSPDVRGRVEMSRTTVTRAGTGDVRQVPRVPM